jgi:hypothetical protein
MNVNDEYISEEDLEKYISQGQDFEKVLYKALREVCTMHQIPDRMILVTAGKFFTQLALQAGVPKNLFLEGIGMTYDILSENKDE